MNAVIIESFRIGLAGTFGVLFSVFDIVLFDNGIRQPGSTGVFNSALAGIVTHTGTHSNHYSKY